MPHLLNSNEESTNPSQSSTANLAMRQKLRSSLTYLIYTGCFELALQLIESTKPKSIQTNTNFFIKQQQKQETQKELDAYKLILNETDEWWTNNPNLFIYGQDLKRKIILTRLNTELRMSSNSSNAKSINNRVQSSQTSSLRDKLIQTKGKTLGRTALMLCCLIEDKNWSFSLAQTLIVNGASLSLKDSNGYNAIMYACLYERDDLLKLFLNAPGDFNLFTRDFFGNTAFHLASLGKTSKLCDLLHKLADKLNIEQSKLAMNKNNFTHSSLDLCKMNNHEACTRKLSYLSSQNYLNSYDDANKSTTTVIQLNQSLPTKFNLIPLFTLSDKLEESVNHNINISNIDPAQSSYCYFDKSINLNLTSSSMKHHRNNRQYMSTTPNPTIEKQYSHLISSYAKFIFVMKEPLIKKKKQSDLGNFKNNDLKNKSPYLKITQENVYRATTTTTTTTQLNTPNTPAPTPTPSKSQQNSTPQKNSKNNNNANKCLVTRTIKIPLQKNQDNTFEFIKEFNSQSSNNILVKTPSSTILSNNNINNTNNNLTMNTTDSSTSSLFFNNQNKLPSNFNFNNTGNNQTLNGKIDKTKSYSWRDDMQNLFEQIEFQKTNSFRRPISSSLTQSSLFEQLAKGILLKVAQNSASPNNDLVSSSHHTNNNRRNSIVNMMKNGSSLSISNNSSFSGGGRRQSILSSSVNSSILINNLNNKNKQMSKKVK